MSVTTPPPLPSTERATLGKRPCPECGGDLQWNAASQSLQCPYCGTRVAWIDSAADTPGAIAELDLEQTLATTGNEQRGYGEDKREVQCQSCQAISVFVDGKVASRCDFCGSPAVVPHESLRDAITPRSVLPFTVSDGQVRDTIRTWYGNRWFAPNRLKNAALTDTLHGVYLPYWTFDAHVDADWTAEAGHHYYTTQTYTQNGQTQTRQVQHTRWEPAAGSLAHFFDDALIAGTRGVHAPLREQIEPFPTTTGLKPYAPEFVRGRTVERYQVDLRLASGLNMETMQTNVRALCANEVRGDTHRNLQVDTTYRGRTFKHVLVPVWLLSYTYGSRNFQVVVNGATGAIAGERPYSWIKITLAVIAAAITLLIVMWLGGQ